jgi:hypothetical protein
MSFAKGLDEMLGLTEPEQREDPMPSAATAVMQEQIPDAPEGEFDEPSAPDPDAPERERDPFKEMVDAALAAEGVDVQKEVLRRYDPTKGDVSAHEWETQREALFAGEKYQFKCKRCLKWLHAGRDQTMNEALDEMGVDANCSNQVVKDMMEA